MGRTVAIDYGSRRIGLASADSRGTIATPAGTLNSTGSVSGDAERILAWARENDAHTIVVGLPLNMDGSDSPQTRHTRALADELRRQATLTIELWDERLSSFQADEFLDAASVPRSRRRKLRDTLAAQVILHSYLDAHRSDAGGPVQ